MILNFEWYLKMKLVCKQGTQREGHIILNYERYLMEINV